MYSKSDQRNSISFRIIAIIQTKTTICVCDDLLRVKVKSIVEKFPHPIVQLKEISLRASRYHF